MKIALFPGTFLPQTGGAEIVTHQLARHLQARGHTVVVLTWWGFWRRQPPDLPYPVRPFLPRTFTWQNLSAWPGFGNHAAFAEFQIAALQKWHRFDLWHAHLAFPAAALLARILPRLHVPYVVTCHGGDVCTLPEIQYGLRLNPHVDVAVRNALQQARAVIAISSLMEETLAAIVADRQKIVRIPNGIDTAGFSPAAEPPGGDTGTRPLRLLSVSRGDRVKNTPFIADIGAVLKSRRLPFQWEVIGRNNEELRDRAAALGLSGEIIIRGEIPALAARRDPAPAASALRAAYHRADVVVVPSLFESFSLVAGEAMACGKPVVASSACGCRDLIQPGINGQLAKPRSAADFADKILACIPANNSRMHSAEIAAGIAAQYSWEKITAAYEQLYRRVVS